MTKKPKPVLGQELYKPRHSYNYRQQQLEECGYPVVVTKVGRKWFTAGSSRYDINTWKEEGDVRNTPESCLYPNKESYDTVKKNQDHLVGLETQNLQYLHHPTLSRNHGTNRNPAWY